jgi:NAD-reducing hydrogenase large subunit
MEKTITIENVTRIEGHAKITLTLNGDGKVDQAHMHVTQVRGFEKFMQGRPYTELPGITARTCGICPVSHLLASSKAGDEIMAVRVPKTAVNLRKLMNYGQILQSHALNFFYLSAPDFLLGMDSDPAQRSLFGIHAANPEMAREGVRLRKFGQQVIERLGTKRIHSNWVIPGGVNAPMEPSLRDAILSEIPEVKRIAAKYLDWFRGQLPRFSELVQNMGQFNSLFLGLVGSQGELEYYDGHLRVVDAAGKILVDRLDPDRYAEIIAEAVEPWTFLKFPYYRPLGYPEGMYRVGPLARLNIARKAGTPMAERYFEDFRSLEPGAVNSSFYYHYARLIEILHCIEKIEELLSDISILDTHVRASAGVNQLHGVGCTEAPRGTLFHDYKVNRDGAVEHINMIIASGNNNLAMNRGVLEAAKAYVDGTRLTEGMLNRVEAVVRAFDPCLACSTHALGTIPIQIELLAPDGERLDMISR